MGRISMSYYFNTLLDSSFEEAISRVTEELKKEGFGILSEIDVQAALKKKLGVDFKKYKILGACNPHFAYQAVQAEDKIGTMLPCNVIVRDAGQNKVEIAAVDPVASMQAIENEQLGSVATEVRSRLQHVIEQV